jgi:hypothetical protein
VTVFTRARIAFVCDQTLRNSIAAESRQTLADVLDTLFGLHAVSVEVTFFVLATGLTSNHRLATVISVPFKSGLTDTFVPSGSATLQTLGIGMAVVQLVAL